MPSLFSPPRGSEGPRARRTGVAERPGHHQRLALVEGVRQGRVGVGADDEVVRHRLPAEDRELARATLVQLQFIWLRWCRQDPAAAPAQQARPIAASD